MEFEKLPATIEGVLTLKGKTGIIEGDFSAIINNVSYDTKYSNKTLTSLTEFFKKNIHTIPSDIILCNFANYSNDCLSFEQRKSLKDFFHRIRNILLCDDTVELQDRFSELLKNMPKNMPSNDDMESLVECPMALGLTWRDSDTAPRAGLRNFIVKFNEILKPIEQSIAPFYGLSYEDVLSLLSQAKYQTEKQIHNKFAKEDHDFSYLALNMLSRNLALLVIARWGGPSEVGIKGLT